MLRKAKQLLEHYKLSCPQEEEPAPPWVPKNGQCIQLYEDSRRARLEDLRKRGLEISQEDWELPGEDFWKNSQVPSFEAPVGVETHVNTQVWRDLSGKIYSDMQPGWERKMELANVVLSQLERGTSSGVNGDGLLPIKMPNFFENPEVDPPRVFDALLRGINSGTIAGPLLPSPGTCVRINALLSVPKPGGDRRQVGDLSSPKESEFTRDRSFNKNVDPTLKTCWPLTQLTAKQFSIMVRSMGKGAWMAKTDLSQAYKCLPVAMEQRKLQRFQFGGRIFEELRMVFGDTYAPMYFDRFHTVILVVFVSDFNDNPRCIWEKCIDDVPVVVPVNRINWLHRHVDRYKDVCDRLGIKLSPMDNSKGFEAQQEGEVLGIIFNTSDMTWTLPERKRQKLISLLRQVLFDRIGWRKKDWEKLSGKLVDFYQLWPPGRFFIESVLRHVKLADEKSIVFPGRSVQRDVRVWLAVLENGKLPLVPLVTDPPPTHYQTYSDASGEILDTPSIGILIPAQFGQEPRVASWEFPRGFLDSKDEEGSKCFRKTTCLETIGILCTLLLAPDLLQGQTVVHTVDNIASSLAWKRRRSVDDRWATVIIRAIGHVCSFLNIDLHTRWQRRRSDRFTEVVDNLSHDCCERLTPEEVKGYIQEICEGFPDPLLKWMRKPGVDFNLGIKLVDWLKRNRRK